jgi:hypothetical protein
MRLHVGVQAEPLEAFLGDLQDGLAVAPPILAYLCLWHGLMAPSLNRT